MEQNEEKVVQVHIENYTGEKPIECIVRKGEAKKEVDPLPMLPPVKCDIIGTLQSPADFLEKRADTLDCKKMYAVVDKENLSIALVVNEDDAYTRRVIKGKAELSEDFVNFRINDSAGWEPAKLGQFIRMHRYLMDDKDKANEIIAKLKNFTAKVKSKLDKAQERNGNMVASYQQEVESNLPTEFRINIEAVVGTGKSLLNVEIDHYVQGTECYLQLFSPDANETVIQYTDSLISSEVARLRNAVPGLVIIEGSLDDNKLK